MPAAANTVASPSEFEARIEAKKAGAQARELDFHPAANAFPLMVGAEFDELCRDILDHGLREAIVLHPDGTILDGRNRHWACRRAEVEPRFETWDGEGGETDFVVSMNIHRRHLTASQRAMVAEKIAKLRDGEKKAGAKNLAPISQTEAAERLKVSRPSVQDARFVREHGTPEEIAAVEAGEAAVSSTAKKIRERTRELKAAVKAAKAEPDRTQGVMKARTAEEVQTGIAAVSKVVARSVEKRESKKRDAVAELRNVSDELRRVRRQVGEQERREQCLLSENDKLKQANRDLWIKVESLEAEFAKIPADRTAADQARAMKKAYDALKPKARTAFRNMIRR